MEPPVFLRFYYLDPIYDIRYLCPRFMIAGKKVMSRRISEGRTSDKICQYEKSRSSLFPRFQHETTILVLQKCRIRVSTSSISTSLLLAVKTSRAATSYT